MFAQKPKQSRVTRLSSKIEKTLSDEIIAHLRLIGANMSALDYDCH